MACHMRHTRPECVGRQPRVPSRRSDCNPPPSGWHDSARTPWGDGHHARTARSLRGAQGVTHETGVYVRVATHSSLPWLPTPLSVTKVCLQAAGARRSSLQHSRPARTRADPTHRCARSSLTVNHHGTMYLLPCADVDCSRTDISIPMFSQATPRETLASLSS